MVTGNSKTTFIAIQGYLVFPCNCVPTRACERCGEISRSPLRSAHLTLLTRSATALLRSKAGIKEVEVRAINLATNIEPPTMPADFVLFLAGA